MKKLAQALMILASLLLVALGGGPRLARPTRTSPRWSRP